MTARGNHKLIHKGYDYNYYKCSVTNDITNWRCSKHRWAQCKGKAQTRKINGKHMVKVYDKHNHQPDLDLYCSYETNILKK